MRCPRTPEGCRAPTLHEECEVQSTNPAIREADAIVKLIREVYRRHQPEKLVGLDGLLSRHIGEEQKIYEFVCKKYGETPEDSSGAKEGPPLHFHPLQRLAARPVPTPLKAFALQAQETLPGLTVNTACARKDKDAVEAAAHNLGWTAVGGKGGTVVWVTRREDMVDRLKVLRPGEWLALIPGMNIACSKSALCEALQASHATFSPRSWSIPEVSVSDICNDAFRNGPATLIVKPSFGTQGQGISLIRTPGDLKSHLEQSAFPTSVVQQYIDPPLLLNGYKWDMRLYALAVTDSLGGIQCFLAREGLVRVCPEPYTRPDSRNLHKLSVHLTNYSISKLSDKFVPATNVQDATQGCKRTLTAVLAYLEQETCGRINAEDIWKALKSLTSHTVKSMTTIAQLAAADPGTWEGCGGSDPEHTAKLVAHKQGQYFQVLGLDVLLCENGQPWLLEVNNKPSLTLDELQPLPVQSKAEINRAFAEAKRQVSGTKWGRPCRCSGHPRPHTHELGTIDVAVKLPVLEGALTIIQRAGRQLSKMTASQAVDVAHDTVFDPL